MELNYGSTLEQQGRPRCARLVCRRVAGGAAGERRGVWGGERGFSSRDERGRGGALGNAWIDQIRGVTTNQGRRRARTRGASERGNNTDASGAGGGGRPGGPPNRIELDTDTHAAARRPGAAHTQSEREQASRRRAPRRQQHASLAPPLGTGGKAAPRAMGASSARRQVWQPAQLIMAWPGAAGLSGAAVG